MIQRIQSIYLLIAIIVAIVAITLFVEWVSVGSYTYAYPAFNAIAACLSLISIFLFGSRKKQMANIVRSNILFLATLIIALIFCFDKEINLDAINKGILAVLPIFSALFNHLAWKAIAKDEQKVRAADRIR